MNDVAFALCALTVAATVQGLTGFGFGMVSMGLLPLVLPVTEAVPIVALLGLVVSSTVLVSCRRSLRLRIVVPLALGSLAGVPFGVWFLTRMDPPVVLTTLGIVLIAFSLHGLVVQPRVALDVETGRGRPWKDTAGAAAAVLGGALGGALNVGGPPLIVYVTWRRYAPAVTKAALSFCFMLASCLQISLFVRGGIVTTDSAITAAAGLPAVAAGLALGLVAGRRVSRETFRRIVLVLLLALGAWFVVR